MAAATRAAHVAASTTIAVVVGVAAGLLRLGWVLLIPVPTRSAGLAGVGESGRKSRVELIKRRGVEQFGSSLGS